MPNFITEKICLAVLFFLTIGGEVNAQEWREPLDSSIATGGYRTNTLMAEFLVLWPSFQYERTIYSAPNVKLIAGLGMMPDVEVFALSIGPRLGLSLGGPRHSLDVNGSYYLGTGPAAEFRQFIPYLGYRWMGRSGFTARVGVSYNEDSNDIIPEFLPGFSVGISW